MSKLKINNLSCQRGYNLLFENLSFELNSGEVLKVSGPNGSGKTSLMKILAGLSSFETGSIDYDETKINSERYNLDFLYLGHLAALSPELSCLENLKYTMRLGNDNLDLDFSDALKKVGLEKFENMISFGSSPRASINLAAASKAYAFIKRRGYVIPEDVRALCHDVLRHRIGLTYEAEAENITSEDIITEILNAVEIP